MPEWLRLLSETTKKGGSTLVKKAATEVVPKATRSINKPVQKLLAPMPAPPLPGLPSAASSFLALPSAQKVYTSPSVSPASDEAIRVSTRRSMGLPDYQIVPGYMSFEELQRFLNTQYKKPASYNALQTMNTGIPIGYAGHINDLSALLKDAADLYRFRRKTRPYTTFGDYEAENTMLDQFGSYAPDESIEPLIREYTQLGLGVPQRRRYQRMQEDIARQMLNLGEITKENPIVKERMDNFKTTIPDLPESFFNTFENITGGRSARESSSGPADQLWSLVTKEVVPGSKLDTQLQQQYGRKQQYILDWDKYRTLLTKINNIDTLPKREQNWLKGVINRSYISPIPGEMPTDAWNKLRLEAMTEKAKSM